VTVQFLSMARSLSPLIRFGTSTWTYECWQGQVYKRQYAKSTSSVQDTRHSISDGSQLTESMRRPAGVGGAVRGGGGDDPPGMRVARLLSPDSLLVKS